MTMRLLFGVLIGFFILGGGGYASYSYFSTPKPQKLVVCDTDLKQCNNGLTVGRISPSCEFALCPEERPVGSGGGITVNMPEAISGAYTGSLESLLKKGGDSVCTFSIDVANSKSDGTLYLSQGEMRGDFSSTVKGAGVMSSHMIQTKTEMATWSDNPKMGMKFALSEAPTRETETALPFDPTVAYTYDCKSWTRDSSLFLLPKDVQFMEPGKMPGLPTGMKIPTQ